MANCLAKYDYILSFELTKYPRLCIELLNGEVNTPYDNACQKLWITMPLHRYCQNSWKGLTSMLDQRASCSVAPTVWPLCKVCHMPIHNAAPRAHSLGWLQDLKYFSMHDNWQNIVSLVLLEDSLSPGPCSHQSFLLVPVLSKVKRSIKC